MRRRHPAPTPATTAPTPDPVAPPPARPSPGTILRTALRALGISCERLPAVAGLSRSACYRVLRDQPTTRRTRRDCARAVGLADDALEPQGGSK